MANQLLKGRSFVPGDTVDADDLNNLVDLAVALPAIIIDASHPVVSALAGDKALLVRAGALKQADVNTFPLGVSSVSAVIDTGASVLAFTVATPTTTPAIHIGLDNQTGNTVLASPANGSTGVPAFRALVPTDIPITTITIAAGTIDWNLGSSFFQNLVGTAHSNRNFIFTNTNEGQTIRVALLQGANDIHVTWPSVRWPNGTAPVMTPTSGRTDIYTFSKFGGVFYGTFDQNFS